jgi:hypothetical protein
VRFVDEIARSKDLDGLMGKGRKSQGNSEKIYNVKLSLGAIQLSP